MSERTSSPSETSQERGHLLPAAFQEGFERCLRCSIPAEQRVIPRSSLSNVLLLESVAEQRAIANVTFRKGKTSLPRWPALSYPRPGVGLGGILSGDTLVLLPKVNLDGLFDHIERYKVLTFFGVPALTE